MALLERSHWKESRLTKKDRLTKCTLLIQNRRSQFGLPTIGRCFEPRNERQDSRSPIGLKKSGRTKRLARNRPSTFWKFNLTMSEIQQVASLTRAVGCPSFG